MRCRYWLKAALQLFGAVLLGAGVYVGMMLLINAKSLSEALEGAADFLLYFGALAFVLFYLGVYRLSVPLALAFGSTRREALLGVGLLRLVLTVLCLGSYCLVGWAVGEQVYPVFGAAALLLAGGFGILLAVLTPRLGKLVMVVTLIVLMLGCGVMGVLVGMQTELPRLTEGTTAWILLLAGAVFQGAMVIPEKKLIDGMTVQI